MPKASATGLALKAMLEDWGICLKLQVLSDSSAARGLLSGQEGPKEGKAYPD